MKVTGAVLARPTLYNFMGRSVRFMLKYAPKGLIYSKMNTWGKARDLPEVKEGNFDQWYKNRQKK